MQRQITATWDAQHQRWKASVGSGSDRKYLWADRHEGEVGAKGEAGEKEAIEKKRAWLFDLAPLRPGSLGEFIEKYYWPHVEKTLAYETRRAYRHIIDNLIPDELMEMLIAEITFADLQVLAEDWSVGVKAKTARNRVGVVQSIFKRAIKLGKVKENVSQGIELGKIVKKKPRRGLTIDFGRKLDELFAGTPDEGIVWASQRFLLRPNEALGLRPQDVVIDSPEKGSSTLYIRVNRQARETKEQLKNKVEGEFRYMVVPTEWALKLLSYAPPGAKYIFCDRYGEPVKPNTVRTRISRKLKKAGIDFQRKELRNLGTSNMIRIGVSPNTLCDIGGWTMAEMVRIYAGLDDDAQIDAFSRLKATYDHKGENE
ncbi:MAG: tyrosine-type recombinase/integrase [Armatimonadetes bacterium]|nr:tyrosine-type recombinase/integrase [Armatimonadota bacterium]